MMRFCAEFNSCIVHGSVELEHCPAEPMTRDYPGSPEGWNLIGVRVDRVVGEFYEVARKDRPDWFEFADDVVTAEIEADLEWLEGRLL